MTFGEPLDMAEEQQQTEGLQEVVSVARRAVEEEFQISERLDSKARGQVTLAGQWFAVVQAVSAVAFAVRGGDGVLLYAVGLLALIGGGLLAATFIRSSRVWKVQEEGALSPQGILTLKGRAEARDADALDVTITHYASLLQDRRHTNKRRSDALEKAERMWPLAMTVPFLQLAAALAARLFGAG